jgi:hypothetical protein
MGSGVDVGASVAVMVAVGVAVREAVGGISVWLLVGKAVGVEEELGSAVQLITKMSTTIAIRMSFGMA